MSHPPQQPQQMQAPSGAASTMNPQTQTPSRYMMDLSTFHALPTSLSLVFGLIPFLCRDFSPRRITSRMASGSGSDACHANPFARLAGLLGHQPNIKKLQEAMVRIQTGHAADVVKEMIRSGSSASQTSSPPSRSPTTTAAGSRKPEAPMIQTTRTC